MSNKIYVGDKKLESYIGAILHNLSEEGSDNDVCHLVSRGRSNNGKALDIAEIAKRDNEAIQIEGIDVCTDEFLNDDEVADYIGIDEERVDEYIEELGSDERKELVEDVGNRVTSVDISITRN